MNSSKLYTIQVEGLRNGIINEIRLLLKNNNLTEIEIPDNTGNATFVVWFDKNGYPHEAQVTKVIFVPVWGFCATQTYCTTLKKC